MTSLFSLDWLFVDSFSYMAWRATISLCFYINESRRRAGDRQKAGADQRAKFHSFPKTLSTVMYAVEKKIRSTDYMERGKYPAKIRNRDKRRG